MYQQFNQVQFTIMTISPEWRQDLSNLTSDNQVSSVYLQLELEKIPSKVYLNIQFTQKPNNSLHQAVRARPVDIKPGSESDLVPATVGGTSLDSQLGLNGMFVQTLISCEVAIRLFHCC